MGDGMDVVAQAGKHPILMPKPAPDFFEGALLGNGGLGVVVTTRPDALVLHVGHNAVWDIRLAEDHAEELGTFTDVFRRVQAISPSLATLNDDPWYRAYCQMAEDNYAQPYPCPMPCGSVLFGWDRREVELVGHTLHIDEGLCVVQFLRVETGAALQAAMIVEPTRDRIWVRTRTEEGGESPAPIFNRIKVLPDPEPRAGLPVPETVRRGQEPRIGFRQVLPGRVDGAPDPRDRAFVITASVSVAGVAPSTEGTLEMRWDHARDLVTCITLQHGRAAECGAAALDLVPSTPSRADWNAAHEASMKAWRTYWERSGVQLDDPELEQVWYWNLYFLKCAVTPGGVCPGLFGNWSYRSIGSAWHGDYHMNYNTEQPFWVTFSSNHADLHESYVSLVETLMPLSRTWAEHYYGLHGAYFPHSAYPVDMHMMPYPTPHWGWELCETPFTVQSLWWHYLYTQDRRFLHDRAFAPIQAAVQFMVEYMMRQEAHGPQWGDDGYHIFPTVVPELYGLTPGFQKNADCLVDLTLTRFIFRAFVEMCTILEKTSEEAPLLQRVQEILDHFPQYPTAESPRGKVWVSVAGEDPETVYNLPNPLTPVFPGEEMGLAASDATDENFAVAVNSYRNHRNEGGNEIVLYYLAGVRLGILDLDRFKRHLRYSHLPNGTWTNMMTETGGRRHDARDFTGMAHMGIWVENFGLPVVINECLLQSYDGTLRLFPNWPSERAAEFRTLRAVGAFLVSARQAKGQVQWVEVTSETEAELRLRNPWARAAVRIHRSNTEEIVLAERVLTVAMQAGEFIRLTSEGRPQAYRP